MYRKITIAAGLVLCGSLSVAAAPRIDNVLIRMVPPGVTSLVGAQMNELTETDLYQKLIAAQKLPQLDSFAKETGFDPRHDVRELLLASLPQGNVLLARGKFPLSAQAPAGAKTVRHGQYTIHTLDQFGYCMLDSTLAAAGQTAAIEAALDEWTRGTHKGATELLKNVASLDSQTPLWGVSTGFAQFLASNLPSVGNGVDFSVVFRGISSSWFSATFRTGFRAGIHCVTANEKDAMNLRDAAKGLIGLGRLSVPDNKPELLRFWDGITVEQAGQNFALDADISNDLIEQMVETLSTPGARGGSGRGGRGGSGGRSGARPGTGGRGNRRA